MRISMSLMRSATTKRSPATSSPTVANVLLGAAVEAGAVGPGHPRLPQLRDHPARAFGRTYSSSRIDSAGLHHAGKLAKSGGLLIIGEHAEHKARDSRVEGRIGKIELGDIHQPKLGAAAEQSAAALGAFEHPWAEVDADDIGAERVERHVAAGPDTGIEHAAAKALEELRADSSIAPALEWPVQKVVERCDPLISFEERLCHRAQRAAEAERSLRIRRTLIGACG